MPITVEQLIEQVKEFLFTTREIVITTNVFAIIMTILCIGYLLYATAKYLNWNNQKPKQTHFKEKKWHPTGWYWDEIDCCWKPPDYMNNFINKHK